MTHRLSATLNGTHKATGGDNEKKGDNHTENSLGPDKPHQGGKKTGEQQI